MGRRARTLTALWRAPLRDKGQHYILPTTEDEIRSLEGEMIQRLTEGDARPRTTLVAPEGFASWPPWGFCADARKLCICPYGMAWFSIAYNVGTGPKPYPADDPFWGERRLDCPFCGNEGVYRDPYKHVNKVLRAALDSAITILAVPPPASLVRYSFDQVRPILPTVVSHVSNLARRVVQAALEGCLSDPDDAETVIAELREEHRLIHEILFADARASEEGRASGESVGYNKARSKAIHVCLAIAEASAWFPRLLTLQDVTVAPFGKIKRKTASGGFTFHAPGHIAPLKPYLALWRPWLEPLGYRI